MGRQMTNHGFAQCMSAYSTRTCLLIVKVEWNIAEGILDVCCGSRMFWFNKQDSRAVFTADIAPKEHCATVAVWIQS